MRWRSRKLPRLDEVVQGLCAEMLVLAGLAGSREDARARTEEAIVSGKAAEVFARMLAALGGPKDFMERTDDYLSKAPVTGPVFADEAGYLAAIDARAIGNAIISLGGGRRKAGEALDLSVGFTEVAPIGVGVGPDRPLAMVHAANKDDLARAIADYKGACTITPAPPAQTPIIIERLTG